MSMTSAMNRVIAAIEQDPTILASAENLDQHPGRTLEELEMLGLRKSDLKKLESAKMAIRARRYRTVDGSYKSQGRAFARLVGKATSNLPTRLRVKPGRDGRVVKQPVLAGRRLSPREPKSWLNWVTGRRNGIFCGGFEVRWILIDTEGVLKP